MATRRYGVWEEAKQKEVEGELIWWCSLEENLDPDYVVLYLEDESREDVPMVGYLVKRG